MLSKQVTCNDTVKWSASKNKDLFVSTIIIYYCFLKFQLTPWPWENMGFFLLITNLSKLFFFKLTTHYQTKVNHCLFKPPLFLLDTPYIGILQVMIVLYMIEEKVTCIYIWRSFLILYPYIYMYKECVLSNNRLTCLNSSKGTCYLL